MTRISSVSNYGLYQHILPEEITDSISDDLRISKLNIERITDEDEKNIKNLLEKNKKIIILDETDLDEIIKYSLGLKDENIDDVIFYYAHWTIAKLMLKIIAEEIIGQYELLKACYTKYVTDKDIRSKKTNYFFYIREHQNFNGYLVSINQLITQYNDLFSDLAKKIDVNTNYHRIIAMKSDTWVKEFIDGTKELLLRGNFGRTAGFPLLRSALETLILREVLNPNNSSKYKGKKIRFVRTIPSLKILLNYAEKYGLGKKLHTDQIRRIYDWQSIVAHRGFRTDDYIIWFIYYYIGNRIASIYHNLDETHIDKILDELIYYKKITIT